MTPAEKLAQYQAPIIARFGRMPSWPELARLERGKAAIVAQGIATRADIMRVLNKPMTCPDVANVIKRTRQLVQRHLQILAAEGRIAGHKVKGVTVWEAKV